MEKIRPDILYAPILKIKYLEGFADDMFIPREGCDVKTLINDMERSLEKISK
jgi:hypothetical protein